MYGWMLTFESAGFFYGITGATHSVVGELTDQTNQSIAFPLYDIVSALGYVIGCALVSVLLLAMFIAHMVNS